MISQQGASTLGSLKQGTGRWRRIAGGAIFAIAVVGAVGVWQVREQSTSRTPSREAAAPAPAAAHGSAGGAGRSDPAASVLYLVDTSDEQAFLTSSLDQEQRERGEQPVRTAVLTGLTLDWAALEQLLGMPGT